MLDPLSVVSSRAPMSPCQLALSRKRYPLATFGRVQATFDSALQSYGLTPGSASLGPR